MLHVHVGIREMRAIAQRLSWLQDETKIGVDITFPAQRAAPPAFSTSTSPRQARRRTELIRPGDPSGREGEIEP
jgi:hypothetical protein